MGFRRNWLPVRQVGITQSEIRLVTQRTEFLIQRIKFAKLLQNVCRTVDPAAARQRNAQD